MEEKSCCPICKAETYVPAEYLPNKFNGKIFSYRKCTSCNSIYVDPFPTQEDLEAMYSGTNDHRYLKDVDQYVPSIKFQKFHYKRYQVDFFIKNKKILPQGRLLDLGCGNGFYIQQALNLGYGGVGVEFDSEFVKVLRKKSGLEVYTLEELEEKQVQFDVIHIGHMLEHLVDPISYMERIKGFAHSETVFIVDGPVENNACLSRNLVNWQAKRNYRNGTKEYNEYDPQHLHFTTYDSQLAFFEGLGLETLKYEVAEQPWPLSRNFGNHSPKEILIALVSRFSIFLSSVLKKQGNVFHYIGKLK